MENMYGIEYSKPTVVLLQDTGIGVAEMAARTCYDSFDASENEAVPFLDKLVSDDHPNEFIFKDTINKVNNIEDSKLLSDLAWTYFHHSILEHANLSFLVKGTSRGVLQEHARHRIQAISVRSTRYTMSSVINAFVASVIRYQKDYNFFEKTLLSYNMFVTNDEYNKIEIRAIWDKLYYQYELIGREEFFSIAIAKSNIPIFEDEIVYLTSYIFNNLQNGKKKRNVGDAFKHIITDNWKVDMVVTFNVRSLKNYFTLRDSGAAYFQIQWLAQQMKAITPKKYLDLIVKEK